MYILCLIMNPSGLAWQYRTFYSNPPCQIAIRVKLEWLEYKENKTRLVEVKEQITKLRNRSNKFIEIKFSVGYMVLP